MLDFSAGETNLYVKQEAVRTSDQTVIPTENFSCRKKPCHFWVSAYCPPQPFSSLIFVPSLLGFLQYRRQAQQPQRLHASSINRQTSKARYSADASFLVRVLFTIKILLIPESCSRLVKTKPNHQSSPPEIQDRPKCKYDHEIYLMRNRKSKKERCGWQIVNSLQVKNKIVGNVLKHYCITSTN